MSVKKTIGGVFAAFLLMILSMEVSGLLASGLVVIGVSVGICNIVMGILYLAITWFLVRILVKKLFKSSPEEMGMPKISIKARYLVLAVILPLAVTASYLLFVKGEFISSDMTGAGIFSTVTAGLFFTGIAAPFVEEIIFRGVMLHLLKKKWNTSVAVIFPSVLFGLIHITEIESPTLSSMLLVALAGTLSGIMFSLIAVKSGSVWNSGIVHAIWNIIVVGGGLTIAGSPAEGSIVTYVLRSDSILLTGGQFGIESSLVALIGYLAVVFMILLSMKRDHSAKEVTA
ncbi:MAG: CPBP family intramembrane metalloprotease [Clostridiales bacterium]|nr:CPBP family intramembrane metalloprotease [Clostridiales bacterium]